MLQILEGVGVAAAAAATELRLACTRVVGACVHIGWGCVVWCGCMCAYMCRVVHGFVCGVGV